LTCSQWRYDEVEKLIKRLEKVAQDAPGPRVRLIRLKHLPAVAAAKMLRELYHDANKAAVFVSAANTNQLVLRCSPAMEAEITSLIRELDVPEGTTN
jgi:hypothetical protein